MINSIHALFRRPDNGWDPIPEAYAEQYSSKEWELVNHSLVEEMDGLMGGLKGKTVLDLGGGPGQYSIAFARKGALVTWHDISKRYRDIAKAKAAESELNIEFSLGYMEEAERLGRRFDFVFNRICWYYCKNDRAFARIVFGLVAPGGGCYIDSINDVKSNGTAFRRVQRDLNRLTGWKIGHVPPPKGRVAELFKRFPVEGLKADYSREGNDRIFFRKGTGNT